MTTPSRSRWDYEVRLLAILATCASIFSFLFYFRHGDMLLYGDAVAHINIARRVFDSKTPGLLQLGTVWLPLPHLLILPFVVSDSLWQSGGGASIPSLAAYVLGVVGIFRLLREALSRSALSQRSAQIASWSAALLYGANPNLLYLQSTAMGEVLYLGFFIWAVVHFAESAHEQDAGRAAQSLTKCGLCLAAACLTRYDGWFLTAAVVTAVLFLTFLRRGTPPESRISGRALMKFLFLAAVGPLLWLAYNAAVYKSPLEFARGPYSARAIEQQSGTINPAKHNLYAAGSYFLKAAELNVGEKAWQGRLWLALAVLGTLAAWFGGASRALLLLWIPLPFYAISIAYGSVPVFVPAWWPFTHYNVRYGLELLPAFAVFIPLAIVSLVAKAQSVRGLVASARARAWGGGAVVLALFVLAADSYEAIWRAAPICYQEAAINMRNHLALDKRLANVLTHLPPNSTLLMYLGDHVGALQQAGIPLRRVINEGNHRVWKQPDDPEGLWERALADPAAYADFVVAFQGDRVWQAMQGRQATELVELHATGQKPAIIYQCRRR